MTLPGSFRSPLSDIEPIGPVDASERISVTVLLRRRAPLPPEVRLTAAELATLHGADPADIDTVTSVLHEFGIEVLGVDAASRRVRIAGPAGILSTVFGTSLSRVRGPGGDRAPVPRGCAVVAGSAHGRSRRGAGPGRPAAGAQPPPGRGTRGSSH